MIPRAAGSAGPSAGTGGRVGGEDGRGAPTGRGPGRPRRLPVSIALLLLAAVVAPLPAAAHGGSASLGERTAGPFRVAATAGPSPRTGVVDVSIVVTDAAGRPVRDGAVAILAAPADRVQSGDRYRARRDAGTAAAYHALVRFPTSGRWEIAVRVRGAAGAGEARLAVDVSPTILGATPPELLGASIPLAAVAAMLVAERLAKRRGIGT